MTRTRGGASGAVGIVMLVLMLAAAVLTATLGPPAGAAENASVRVVVTSLSSPVLKGAKDPVVIGFDVVNNTKTDLTGVTAQLRVGQGLTLRGELTGDNSTGHTVSGVTIPPLNVPAGGRTSAKLTTTADKLGLAAGSNAVYPLTVDAVDGDSSVASARLLVPWLPKPPADLAKTQVGVLWPLIDQPRRDGTTIGDDGQTPVFLNDGLTAELAEQGRLNALVRTGQTIPKATWVIDPDLLDTAAAMERGYRVAPPMAQDASGGDSDDSDGSGGASGDGGGKNNKDSKDSKDKDSDTATAKAAPRTEEETEPGTGGPAAAAWLQMLRNATGGEAVVALPYSDTDLAAVAHAGTTGSKVDLMPQLTAAIARGGATTQSVLGRGDVRTDLAWPYAGALDNAILDAAKNTGSSLVVASGASLQTPPKLTYTPSTRQEVGPNTDALVTDARIDALLSGAGAMSQVELQQALIAELFTIAMEEPTNQRSLLIAPPRTMSASVAQALAAALQTATAPGGWSETTTLDALAVSKPGEQRSMKAYPQDLRRTEPSERYLKTVPDLQQSLDAFAHILTKPERVTAPYNPAVLRTLSTAWRGGTMNADTYRLDVTRSLRVLQQLVRIAPKTGVTLSGESGTIPVTIINGLQQAINVRVDAQSRQPNRLSVTNSTDVATIPGGRTQAIKVEAESAANGKVLVDVRILTPQGQEVFGPTQTFYVNTTSIDGITLGIIGVIAGLLALFSLRAYLRRRRTSANGDGDGDGSDDGSDGGSGDGASGGAEAGGNDWGDPAHGARGAQARIEGGTRRHSSRDRPEDYHAPA